MEELSTNQQEFQHEHEHTCINCGADIVGKRKDAKYCSEECRSEYNYKKKKAKAVPKKEDKPTLNGTIMSNEKVLSLEQQLEEERKKRIAAEEQAAKASLSGELSGLGEGVTPAMVLNQRMQEAERKLREQFEIEKLKNDKADLEKKLKESEDSVEGLKDDVKSWKSKANFLDMAKESLPTVLSGVTAFMGQARGGQALEGIGPGEYDEETKGKIAFVDSIAEKFNETEQVQLDYVIQVFANRKDMLADIYSKWINNQ